MESKVRSREYYPSNINGTKIVNAISGLAYNDKVGSYNEKKYFRVLDCKGNVDEKGYKLSPKMYNPTSNKLFYDNEEEYLKHLKMRT